MEKIITLRDLFTTIRISKHNWEKLNNLRKCGESFDVVLEKILSDEPAQNFINVPEELKGGSQEKWN